MPLVPRVMPMSSPVQREPATVPNVRQPAAASPSAEAASVAMPQLPEGLSSSERASALMAELADPRSWLKD